MADTSQIRNAARDMVKDMLRFERDFARFQRVSQEAAKAGVSDAEIRKAINESVAGHPDMRRKLTEFTNKLAAASN